MKDHYQPNPELSKEVLIEYVQVHNPHDPSLQTLISEISSIAINGFGAEFATPEVICQMLVKESHVFYARDILSGHMLGFQLTQVFEINGMQAIYYSRVMSKKSQGQSIGKKILLKSINSLQADMICARTQNPAALLSIHHTIQKLKPSIFFPFTRGKMPQQDIATILATIEMQTQGSCGAVNLVTGVQKNAFSQRLGDYQIQESNPEIARINKYLTQNGLDRERGDAQYYFVIFDKSKLQKSRENDN